jgi:hypothetical protein
MLPGWTELISQASWRSYLVQRASRRSAFTS